MWLASRQTVVKHVVTVPSEPNVVDTEQRNCSEKVSVCMRLTSRQNCSEHVVTVSFEPNAFDKQTNCSEKCCYGTF